MAVVLDNSELQYVRRPPDNELRLAAASLDALCRSDAELQVLVRPPLPQIQPLAPRFGYGDYSSRIPGVRDVFTPDDRFGNPRVDFSQRLSGYAGGTNYPSLNVF
jgi:hypothetical protein